MPVGMGKQSKRPSSPPSSANCSRLEGLVGFEIPPS